MDSSFTEHVLERARQRQKKLAPLKEANLNVTETPPSKIETTPIKRTETLDLSPLKKQSSVTKITSSLPGSPLSETKTLNIQRDSFNMEIKFNSAENVRLEVEIDTDSDNGGENVEERPALREQAKSRLQRLGKLYAGNEELSSPIHRTEGEFVVDDDRPAKEKTENSGGKPRKGLGRLADLANNINQWEDEIAPVRIEPKPKANAAVLKKSWKPPAPQPPQVSSPAKTHTAVKSFNSSPVKSPLKPPAPKPPVGLRQIELFVEKQSPCKVWPVENKGDDATNKLNLDKAVLDCLESQGFTRTTSNSRLIYNYATPQDDAKESESIKTKQFVPLHVVIEEEKVTPRSPTKNKSKAIASKTALFEQKWSKSPAKKDKDPSLLSVSERKALFEKNPGAAPPVPKSAYVAPTKSNRTEGNDELTPVKSNRVEGQETGGIAEKIALLSNKSKATISQEQIEAKVKEERRKEMEVLMNRFQHNKQAAVQEDSDSEVDEDVSSEKTAMITSKVEKIVPSTPGASAEKRRSGEKRPKKGDSPQVQAVLGDVKRIKVTQPKDGQLYPCLSDIETATETEPERTETPSSDSNSLLEDYSICTSEDGANTSFGREILKAVCQNQAVSEKSERGEQSDSEFSDVLDDMDEYLHEFDTDSAGPTPPKNVKLQSPKKQVLAEPSESFNYKKFSPKKPLDELPTHVVDGNDVLPLTYTVSFYRKQQTQSATPVRHVTRQPCLPEECDDVVQGADNLLVQEKIARLVEEVQKQQMIISQTSRALNLCNSTPEFTGSVEQVEAEKLLLLATHRRQAANLEMQRLKVEGTLRPSGTHAHSVPLEKATVIISNIVLPLKKEYVRALAAAGGKGHHVICLVRSDEQVVSTQVASTVASSPKNPDLELVIPGQVKLENIYSDFTITFEVYCLRAQEEILPHELKYHINKKSNNKTTPKKVKQDSKLSRPPKESPAGPQAVRSPTFALNGYVVFSIQAINKTCWTLNKTPPISPLEGSVTMKVSCELNVSAEMRGFLNMFEDISGLGAWHRRWCLLKGHILSYWKYPEDERKKAPIDTIDLKTCITKQVGPVSRDVCARLNTFLLEREREPQDTDKDTLTVTCGKDKTIIKHLLSADTKEERIEWCDNLNKALAAMRIHF